MDERVQNRLRYWKSQLIDTSKRNRLLFSSPSRSNTVKLVEPPLDNLFDRLVAKGQVLQFYPQEEEQQQNLLDFDEPSQENAEPPPPRPLRVDEVRSSLGDKPLWRRLYTLRQKARTSLQEQGVVTLFVAFGFLEWIEARSSDVSFWSPLILVPVELVQESSRSPYKLRLFEEDIALNPTLLHKMQTDFALTLPDLPEIDALDPEAFFREVAEAVSGQKKWSVVAEAHLGLFSFHKIAMYRDLEAHSDKATKHPLVRALAGDPSHLASTPRDLPGGEDLDRLVAPSETYQILDADSSQQEAIQAAKRGVSFILQGPPGTGKSQTIANIIAECVADGKKVLFVSEKMAALEVVYRRLADNGIGDFCLEAHSHKANKKEVVEALGRSLDGGDQRSRRSPDVDFAELQRLRQRLNGYAKALHVVHPPLGRTVYQVHGELAHLHGAPDLNFMIQDVQSIGPADLTQFNELFEDMARLHDILLDAVQHPWNGVQIVDYKPFQDKADIRIHFTALTGHIAALEEQARKLATLCGVDELLSVTGANRLLNLAQHLASTPRPPARWLRGEALAPLIEQARVYQTRFNDYRARRSSLLQVYRESLFTLSHTDLIERLTTRQQAVFHRMPPGEGAEADRLLRNRGALAEALSRVSLLLERLGRSAPALARACSLEPPTTMSGIGDLCQTMDLLLQDPRPQPDWFDRSRLLALKTAAEEASAQYGSYKEGRAKIAARYVDNFLSLDHAALIERFTGPYGGVLRFLNPGYYRDLKTVRTELKAPEKLSYSAALHDLKSGKQVAERKLWIEAHQAEHARDFGRHFNGLDTAWNTVGEAVDVCRRILDRIGDGRLPDGLIRLLAESGPALISLRAQKEAVQAELNRLGQEGASLHRLLSLDGLPFTDRAVRDADLTDLRQWIDEVAAGVADFGAAWDTVMACRGSDPGDVSRVADVIAALSEAQALVTIEADVCEHAFNLNAAYGHLFSGIDTRWEEVLYALGWTGGALEWFGTQTPPDTYIRVATGEAPGAEQVGALAGEMQATIHRFHEELEFLLKCFPRESLRIAGSPFEEAPLAEARAWVQLRLDRLHELDRWMEFRDLCRTCNEAGLAPFLAAVARARTASSDLRPAFYKRFWALWLDAVYTAEPALMGFDGQRHEAAIARFRELDAAILKAAQSRIRERLLRQRPVLGGGSAPSGELSILLKERGKKKRLKPLRRLFAEIPNLLQALKPCMLMGPLSVATFLDAHQIEFDVVIFDEASQICSEDAVGAIMRGKQLIVVGDSKQLPPTRFFSASNIEDYDDEEEEEEAASEVYESILDECATIRMPSWMLRWHYRSKCEALIAFSNHHFYDDRLVTFPGPCVDAEEADRCVQLVHVPGGVYRRGKDKDAGTNRVEARKVAEMVFEHFATQPDRSLGVIAFSERQQTAIDDEIRHLRSARPQFEHFFAEQGEEPFFIKNLENVQGDERDMILFSVGYAKDPTGKLSMNFGPLNKEGGERRLNVAVTRAKHQVKLVSSIEPTDMDLSRTAAKGPALLKYYMEFAHRGPSSLAREIHVSPEPEFDSPFEEEVCHALEARGLTVHRQVGCAGYRIDLAVVDDEHRGEYLLGIECDGATYHSSKTARDRDRLRQYVLEEMGWRGRILRIWSSDWIRSPDTQILRVLEALGGASQLRAGQRNSRNDGLSSAEAALEDEPGDVEIGEMEILAAGDDEDPADTDMSDAPSREPKMDLTASVVPYRACEVDYQGPPEDFYFYAENRPGRITDVLIKVVQEEGPIHITEATRRVVSGWGMGKAGANLLRYVSQAAQRAVKRGVVEIRGDFLWPSGATNVVVRGPAEDGSVRSIEMVSLEEIAEASFLCVRDAFAIQIDELVTQAARLLGYNRTGAKVRDRIEEGIALCSQQGRVSIKNGSVSLVC